MQAIKSNDRVLVYKIECARFTFCILERSWASLCEKILSIRQRSDIDELKALDLMSYAWQVVDHAYRFHNVLKHIPKLDRKDIRFRAVEKSGFLLKEVRNYIQHVDSETHKLKALTSYPILGALAWGLTDGSASISICLGTLPEETSFHTVAYDVEEGAYLREVLLCVADKTLNLQKVFNEIYEINNLLNEFLFKEKLLATEDVEINFIHAVGMPHMSGINDSPAGKGKFLRFNLITQKN